MVNKLPQGHVASRWWSRGLNSDGTAVRLPLQGHQLTPQRPVVCEREHVTKLSETVSPFVKLAGRFLHRKFDTCSWYKTH